MATLSQISTAKDVVSLLRIPLEIRNKIYHNLLVSSDIVYIIPEGHGLYYCTTADEGVFTSILITCKQAAFEATRIIYKSNIFEFLDFASMNKWLDMINPDNVHAVQNARIHECYEMMNTDALEKVSKRCTGLKRLRIDWHRRLGSPAPEVNVCELFESAKRVVRDHAKLKMVACTQWGKWHDFARLTWEVSSITLVANIGDLSPDDGEIFHIEKAVVCRMGQA